MVRKDIHLALEESLVKRLEQEAQEKGCKNKQELIRNIVIDHVMLLDSRRKQKRR